MTSMAPHAIDVNGHEDTAWRDHLTEAEQLVQTAVQALERLAYEVRGNLVCQWVGTDDAADADQRLALMGTYLRRKGAGLVDQLAAWCDEMAEPDHLVAARDLTVA